MPYHTHGKEDLLMTALVTCGGTAEPIDDVRHVTNFATGKFGLTLARHAPDGAIAACSRMAAAYAQTAEFQHDNIERFQTTDDLAGIYHQHAEQDDVDVVIAAAAVSDYRPTPAAGKLSSDSDTLTIELQRTPKLIDKLRELYGRSSYLVGFKLLVDAHPHDLWAAARQLLRRARLDLVVANDLTECADGQHPVWLITAEGGAIRVTGTRNQVAAAIWRFIQQRRNVTFSSTTLTDTQLPAQQLAERWTQAHDLAQHAQLLYDPSGNIAAAAPQRPAEGQVRLLISPRGVDKSTIGLNDALVVDVEPANYRNICRGPVKCSIDTAPSARIVAHTDVDVLIHFHQLWGKPQQTTLLPLPCGAAEEADLVIEALQAAGATTDPMWLIELVHHGALLGADTGQLKLWQQTWQHIKAGWNDHLQDVGRDQQAKLVRPIFNGIQPAGVVATYGRPDGRDGHAVWLPPAARGHGLGRTVVKQLTLRQQRVVTADDCGVVGYWHNQGFTGGRAADGLWDLTPPPVTDTDPVVGGLARRDQTHT